MSASWGGDLDSRSTATLIGGGRRRIATQGSLAMTFAGLARLAADLADQAGLLDVMVAEVGDTPADEAQAATSRAATELRSAARALTAVAEQVHP
ncbi:MAG: hypothetical protein ACFCVF_06390 [Kineosporiaceae bacterium]